MVALREPAHVVALARFADDLGYRAARRMPVVLLALDCLLHHLVGNVGGKAREALLRRLVLPEAEQRRDELACGERDEDEREHSREDASQGGGCARDGAAYRLRRCALRCCRRLGAACSLGRLRLDGSLGADGRGACALGRALPLGGPRGARRLLCLLYTSRCV